MNVLGMTLYIVSLALQLTSSALLINLSIRRKDIIKMFSASNIIFQDGNTKKITYNHEEFKKYNEQINLARISFLYLAIGIFMSIFGINVNFSKFIVFFLVLLSTLFLYFYSKYLVTTATKKIKPIDSSELTEDIDVAKSLSNKEIDEICEKLQF